MVSTKMEFRRDAHDGDPAINQVGGSWRARTSKTMANRGVADAVDGINLPHGEGIYAGRGGDGMGGLRELSTVSAFSSRSNAACSRPPKTATSLLFRSTPERRGRASGARGNGHGEGEGRVCVPVFVARAGVENGDSFLGIGSLSHSSQREYVVHSWVGVQVPRNR